MWSYKSESRDNSETGIDDSYWHVEECLWSSSDELVINSNNCRNFRYYHQERNLLENPINFEVISELPHEYEVNANDNQILAYNSGVGNQLKIKLSIYFSYILRKQKEVENSYPLNCRNSLLKINLSKLTILSNFADSQDLSERSLI